MTFFPLYLSLLTAASMRLNVAPFKGFSLKAKKSTINCGMHSVVWPSRNGAETTVEVSGANTCSQCFLYNDEGKGCNGDCMWDKEKKECLFDPVADVSLLEWIAIILSLLVVLLALFLLFLWIHLKFQNVEAQRKMAAQRAKRALERQQEMEMKEAGPPEKEEDRKKSLIPLARGPLNDKDGLTPVTQENVRPGLAVVRGPSWEFTTQDGGAGTIGIVSYCIQAPYWWMVQWPNTPIHAYYCGESEDARCDLALAP